MRQKVIAITGPSGVGKTTLGDLLIERNQFVYPVHSTTRNPRPDDKIGFYNYLSHDVFKDYALNNDFMFWSGDSDIISINNGNFYGILNKDFNYLSDYDKILMFISYKDVLSVLKLKNNEFDVDIVNLIYDNLENAMIERLSDEKRGHSWTDIENRINCAKDYEKQFKQVMSLPNILKIPTDIYGVEETYNIVRKRLVR